MSVFFLTDSHIDKIYKRATIVSTQNFTYVDNHRRSAGLSAESIT